MLIRRNRFKKMMPYAVIVFLCVGIVFFAFAAHQTKAMAGKQDESKEMKHKEMHRGDMMEHREMMCKMDSMMCPMHMRACERMMEIEIVDTQDGGVIIMAAGKLYKYDKDINLVKEVELKACADMKEKMGDMRKECMEKCQLMMKDKGKPGSM